MFVIYIIGVAILFGLFIAIMVSLVSVPFWLGDILKNFLMIKRYDAEYCMIKRNDPTPSSTLSKEDVITLNKIHTDCEETFKNMNIKDPKLQVQVIEQALKEHGFVMDNETKTFRKEK